MKIAAILLSLVLIGGCQTTATTGKPATGGAKLMTRTELTFGSGRSDGPDVSDWAWRSFVDKEVTPRFPDGLSIIPIAGQWKGKSGEIVHERAWMLILIHNPSPENDRKIEELREIYKKQFSQEAVIRADIPESVSF